MPTAAPQTPAEALDQAELPPARNRKKPPHDAVLARQSKAVALRLSGLTFDQVAEHAGYASRSAARGAVLRALKDVEVSNVDELRRLESLRLDRLLAACWQGAVKGDAALIREARRITETRARLLGLNAPIQIEDVTGVDDEINQLRTALAAEDVEGVFTVTQLEDAELLEQAS
jgi:hypothetical protein